MRLRRPRRPGRSGARRLRTASLPLLPLTVIGAVLAGLIGPEPTSDVPLPGADAVADSYDGFDADAAEQLRQDQCLMAGALRLGGPEMGSVAQTALNQTPQQLHVAADREYWNDTPLALAYVRDRGLIDQESATLDPRRQAW
ncbi:hypothetical protein SUDANB140_02181 [Streptomyces sp. enrichment culture]